MIRKTTVATSALGALISISSPAGAEYVDFEGTPGGSYSSLTVGSTGNQLTLTSPSGSIFVSDFGFQSHGTAAAAFGTYLRGDFQAMVNSISFEFGNDDTCCGSLSGDIGALNLFLNGTLVGTSSVVLNRNDVMDQSIAFSGASFDAFTFTYQSPTGQPNGLAEVIDNLAYSAAPVPEPSTWAMMLIGFGAVGFAMRRRRPVVSAQIFLTREVS